MSQEELFEDDIPEPPARVISFTKNQQAVYDSIRDHGFLHFYGARFESEAELIPRLFPLVAGPTGSGKSFLIRQVARELDADYFRLTYGDFIPLGARDPAAATMVRLGRKLAHSNRLLVHLDEIDKWLISDREWGRSITTDLWNLLDCVLPWEQIIAADPSLLGGSPEEQTKTGKDDIPDPPVNLFRTDHMFIVGSGTWQSIFEHRITRTVGFQGGSATPQPSDRDLVAAIRRSKVIPTELSARFSTDILVLGYPSREETEELLDLYGLRQLAADMGIRISASDVDFAAAGMRAFESLKTRLLLENLRRRRRDDYLEGLDGPSPSVG